MNPDEAVTLIGELAERTPLAGDDHAYPPNFCFFCDEGYEYAHGDHRTATEWHLPSCLWRRAKEAVAGAGD